MVCDNSDWVNGEKRPYGSDEYNTGVVYRA